MSKSKKQKAEIARSYNTDSGTVLLLNRDGTPFSIVHWHEAVRLLSIGKVLRIKDTNTPIRSAHLTWMKPSVVMLKRYVKAENAKVGYSRRAVFERDEYTCQYCGKIPHLNGVKITVDHVNPRCLGGKSIFENTVTCCSTCNKKKGGHTLKQCGMKLLQSPPKTINAAELARKMMTTKLKRVIDFRPDWKEFLG